MRKILAVLMLVCALELFAQIPAETKSIALSGQLGDLLHMDSPYALGYIVTLGVGYFPIENFELAGAATVTREPIDGGDSDFLLGGGIAYHHPINPKFGLFGGIAVSYHNAGASAISIPIVAGIEVFLNKNVAIQVYNDFIYRFDENVENNNFILTGIAAYFE